mmetsp:Transcript_39605/g.86452  ORF Transcript_39605/g.86452 Transcript_39605/m.86452 type:complete len:280 (-) Transcript_39605:284-1123(-)
MLPPRPPWWVGFRLSLPLLCAPRLSLPLSLQRHRMTVFLPSPGPWPVEHFDDDPDRARNGLQPLDCRDNDCSDVFCNACRGGILSVVCVVVEAHGCRGLGANWSGLLLVFCCICGLLAFICILLVSQLFARGCCVRLRGGLNFGCCEHSLFVRLRWMCSEVAVTLAVQAQRRRVGIQFSGFAEESTLSVTDGFGGVDEGVGKTLGSQVRGGPGQERHEGHGAGLNPRVPVVFDPATGEHMNDSDVVRRSWGSLVRGGRHCEQDPAPVMGFGLRGLGIVC